MMAFIHRMGSPRYFYEWTGAWVPWLAAITFILMVVGTYWGLVIAPPDYQQGESARIMYIHVPSAWLSMFVYMVMAVASAVTLIWKIKVTEVVISQCAVLGASFTALALITGMLWGKPMWGAYWVWDARLTSELILLFLYLGVLALASAMEDPRTGARAAAILALVGVVNIPIIHYSVEWWNTLHQGPTVTKFDSPSAHPSMLWPLFIMAFAFKAYFGTLLLIRTRSELLLREQHTQWVKEIVGAK